MTEAANMSAPEHSEPQPQPPQPPSASEQQQQQQQQPSEAQAEAQPEAQQQPQVNVQEDAPNDQQPQPEPEPEPEPQQQQHQQQQQQQDQDQAPASPPLPPKHTPVTPGPRATRFIELYDLTLQRTLTRVNYDNFASCFPTIAAHAPNTLRNVQKQMVDYLEERCNKDFQSILVDRDVVRKLNELENLVSDAERRRQESADADEPIPPHLLPPDEVMTAHLAPRLASQQSHLNARLQNTQAANESLFAAIRSQRAELDALLAQLENHVADIDGANAMLVDVAPELAAEARAAEAEMAVL